MVIQLHGSVVWSRELVHQSVSLDVSTSFPPQWTGWRPAYVLNLHVSRLNDVPSNEAYIVEDTAGSDDHRNE